MEVIIYTSPTCGPCKQIKPHLIELAMRHKFHLRTVEASMETQHAFVEAGIRAVPTIVIAEDGKEVARHTGAATRALLEAFLKERRVIE